MSYRDIKTDSILNKYGLCSYVAPDVHHYSFKKIKFVRPERHISSYVRKTGVYDLADINYGRRAKIPYVGVGPVDANQSQVFETRSSYGNYASGLDYTPRRPRLAEHDMEPVPDFSTTRLSGNMAMRSEYSYAHAPRDYDSDKWYMRTSRYSDYDGSRSNYDSANSMMMEFEEGSARRYLVPDGFDSFKEYNENQQMRDRLQISERQRERPGLSFTVEYLQGVDSRGYSYHHGNLKEAACGGGADCRCIGASHYDVHAYRICPPWMNCSGRVTYRRDAPSIEHQNSDLDLEAINQRYSLGGYNVGGAMSRARALERQSSVEVDERDIGLYSSGSYGRSVDYMFPRHT